SMEGGLSEMQTSEPACTGGTEVCATTKSGPPVTSIRLPFKMDAPKVLFCPRRLSCYYLRLRCKGNRTYRANFGCKSPIVRCLVHSRIATGKVQECLPMR